MYISRVAEPLSFVDIDNTYTGFNLLQYIVICMPLLKGIVMVASFCPLISIAQYIYVYMYIAH